MKTDNQNHVGKHAFEVAGLGLAPFRCVGVSQNRITYPDGSGKPGGTCDYCGTGIEWELRIKSADGKQFVVGCNCVEKVGDRGLLQAYKNSPEARAHKRALAQAKAAKQFAELNALISANEATLASWPHPYGFVCRESGRKLNYLDQIQWSLPRCGNAARASWLRTLTKKLAEVSK